MIFLVSSSSISETINPNDQPYVVLIIEFYLHHHPNKPPFSGNVRAEAYRLYRECKNPTATDSQCKKAITYYAMKMRIEVIKDYS